MPFCLGLKSLHINILLVQAGSHPYLLVGGGNDLQASPSLFYVSKLWLYTHLTGGNPLTVTTVQVGGGAKPERVTCPAILPYLFQTLPAGHAEWFETVSQRSDVLVGGSDPWMMASLHLHGLRGRPKRLGWHHRICDQLRVSPDPSLVCAAVMTPLWTS